MTVSVTHTTVAVGANDPTKEVSSTAWNESHTVTGLGTAAEAATTDFATAAQGAKADTALQPAAIGVTVQAYDADLTSWAGVNPSSYSTTAQIAAAYQPLDADLTAWAAVNPSSYSTTAQIAAAYQPLDSDLTAIAGLSPTNDDIVQRKAGAWTNRTLAQLMTDLAALGTTFQPLDSDLTTIAGLTATTNNFIVSVGSAWASRTPTQVKTTLGLTVGTDVQAYDAALLSVAGVSWVAGDLGYWSGTDTAARLAKGTAYQILRMNSGATAPEWATDREVLTANRTYYVRTDGSDSNTGLVNNSGGAFLTVQAAVNKCATIDFGGYVVTIQIADGTYAGVTQVGRMVGQKAITDLSITGNTGTPANVVLSASTSNQAPIWIRGGMCDVRGVKLTATGTTVNGILVSEDGKLNLGTVEFGSVTDAHIHATSGALVEIFSNYSITAGGLRHMFFHANAILNAGYITVTLTGTPAFSGVTMLVEDSAACLYPGVTFSGSATGTRYSVTTNAVLQTYGGGASYFPGNAAGSTATGGQYA